MIRAVVLTGAIVVLGTTAGCKSYETEWRQSQQQLQAAEARVRALQQDLKVRDDAIAQRDAAISERDLIIRNQCVAKPVE